MLSPLREAGWLTAERARGYGIILSIALGVGAVCIVAARFGASGHARQMGPANDFLTFLAAGDMVRQGHSVAIYDLNIFTAALSHYASMGQGRLPFLYPPVMLLLCGAITYLPQICAYAAFEAVTLVPLLVCLRRMLPPSYGTLPLLAAPAFVMNIGSGQTGFFPALGFAGGALLMRARPGLAGLCLGLLLFKPHFALLVPVALGASRNWRAFWACAACAACLAALPLLAFPARIWLAFFDQPGLMKFMLEHGTNILLSVGPFGAMRAAGAPLGIAYAVQAASAGLALGLVVTAAWRRPAGGGLIALTAAASLLFSPYAQDYDLAVAMVPLVWLAAAAAANGWRPWEKMVALLVYLLPLFSRITVLLTGFQPAPFLLLALLLVVWRRMEGVSAGWDGPSPPDPPSFTGPCPNN